MITNIKRTLDSNIGKIVTNASWIFFDRVFRIITGMIVGVWAARYLGPSQYGIWNYATAFTMFILPLSRLGLTNILLNTLIREKNFTTDEIISTGFHLKLLSGILSTILILILNSIINNGNELIKQLVLIISIAHFFQSFEVIDIFYQSKTKSKRSVFAKTIAFVIATGIKIYLLAFHYSLIFFVASSSLELAVGVIILVKFYKDDGNNPISLSNYNNKLSITLLKSSFPIVASEFFSFLYMKVDQFMLEKMVSSYELGRYSAVLKLSETWYFISIIIVNSFYPSIASIKDKNPQEFTKKYKQLFTLLALIGIIVSVSITVISKPLTYYLYGVKYYGINTILDIHIWTGLFLFLGVGAGNLLIMEGKQNIMFIRDLSGLVSNICLNFYFIPKYGAIGASISTLISQIVASYLINLIIPNLRYIFYMQTEGLLDALRLKYKNLTILAQ